MPSVISRIIKYRHMADAVTSTVADLVSVFGTFDYLTRKAVIDSFVKAHAAANTITTNQKFSRKKK